MSPSGKDSADSRGLKLPNLLLMLWHSAIVPLMFANVNVAAKCHWWFLSFLFIFRWDPGTNVTVIRSTVLYCWCFQMLVQIPLPGSGHQTSVALFLESWRPWKMDLRFVKRFTLFEAKTSCRNAKSKQWKPFVITLFCNRKYTVDLLCNIVKLFVCQNTVFSTLPGKKIFSR